MFVANKDAEVRLVETLSSIADEANSWRALHFRLSQLQDHYRSDYQIKIAVNMVNDQLKQMQGGIFLCLDSDIFVVCRNITKAQMDKVTFQLRYLFMDDPLSYTLDGQDNPEFCHVYDLSVAYDECSGMAKRRLAMLSRKGGGAANTLPKEGAAPSAKAARSGGGAPLPPASDAGSMGNMGSKKGRSSSSLLTPQHLATIERELSNADLSRVLRRQPVCAAVPSMMIRKVFDEIYINIAHLRQFLKTDIDLLSNRWLFKYLTQVLDERIMLLLKSSPTRFFDNPVSLNLNVQTLLSHYFTEFDAAIKPATKVSIVIEIQIADVFADMGAFMAAKEHVQRLGYRVCLDGLTSLSFTQVDREKLGFDLAKLQWNADIESDIKSKENRQLAEAIKHTGVNRVILCRCDSKQAIDYGQALGLSLFQGRYLDGLMNPASKVEN